MKAAVARQMRHWRGEKRNQISKKLADQTRHSQSRLGLQERPKKSHLRSASLA
jgi:hypothetical protein